MTEPSDHDLTVRLTAWAHRQPEAPALLAPDRAPMSFRALAARIDATRRALAAWGIGRGDVVAWPVVDRPMAAAALAILPVGCTIAPLAARASVAAQVETLSRLRPKAIVLAGGDSPAAVAARTLALTEIVACDDGSGVAGAFDLALARRTPSLDRRDRLSPGCAAIGATSGSTGRPKLVTHGHRQIVATAKAMAGRLAIGPGDVSGHVSPLHLAGGIRNAYLHSIANGGAAVVLPEMDATALIGAIDEGRVTYVSASFALLRELIARLEAGAAYSPGRLRFVRIASGRLEPGEVERLEALLRAPVVTGLSSSEAGSMTHQRLPPAPRLRGSVGPPLDSEIRLVDEDGVEVVDGAAGEIIVRGPQVFDGYVDDDELNARAFVGGWFRTGDLGRVDAAGEIHVIGRVKDVINRGGDKISPAEIDAVLVGMPELADAAAFGVPHSRLGEEVAAVAVMRPGHAIDEASLRHRVSERLGPRCAPRRVWFVDAVPRNAAGKVNRGELARRFGGVAANAGGPLADGAAAPGPLEAAVAGIWSSVLGAGPIGLDVRFADLGGGPGQRAALAVHVREVFGVELPREAFDADTTVRSLASSIEGARIAEEAERLRALR